MLGKFFLEHPNILGPETFRARAAARFFEMTFASSSPLSPATESHRARRVKILYRLNVLLVFLTAIKARDVAVTPRPNHTHVSRWRQPVLFGRRGQDAGKDSVKHSRSPVEEELCGRIHGSEMVASYCGAR
jgi:hypothetical protein